MVTTHLDTADVRSIRKPPEISIAAKKSSDEGRSPLPMEEDEP